jgi:hypothetical protein
MKQPHNAEFFETPISTHWFDENGILCGVGKVAERTIEHYHKLMELYKDLTKNGNKLCVLTNLDNTAPLHKEISEFLGIETPKYVKAMAIITNKPMTETLSVTFLKLSLRGFPVVLFSKEEEAREWLKEYL